MAMPMQVSPPTYPSAHPYPEILPILSFGAMSGRYEL